MDKSPPEIESFNLADLDVAALDVRLELSSLIPACTLIDCVGYDHCNTHCASKCDIDCMTNGGCNCYSYS